MRKIDKEEDYILGGAIGLSDEFIMSIGRLTLNFAHLEFCFTLFAGSQLGVASPLNQIVTSELSFRQLLNVTQGIYNVVESNDERLANFNEIVRNANILEQQRNKITHSFYGQQEESQNIIRYKNTTKGKQGFKEQKEIVNAESINKIACEISELSTELMKVLFFLK